MGNNLISEHAAGVHTMGPVLPPPGYQQQQHQKIAINKQTGIGPYGELQHGVTVQKETVNTQTGLGHAHGNPYLGHDPHGLHHQGGYQQQQNLYQPLGIAQMQHRVPP
jgi:hypothetical protein